MPDPRLPPLSIAPSPAAAPLWLVLVPTDLLRSTRNARSHSYIPAC